MNRDRIKHLVHFHTPEIAAVVLIPLGIIVWWLTGDYSPLR